MGKASTKVIVALAVLFVLLAVFQVRQQRGTDHGDMAGRHLFPQLDLAAVAEVRVESGDDTLNLHREAADHWGVVQRSGYPVDGEKLRRLVLSMAQLQAQDQLTDNPEKYSVLGVDDPSAQGTVRLLDTDGKTLATLRLGKRKETKGPGSPGQFVRIDDDPAVYVVPSAPAAEADAVSWLDRDLVDVAADQVAKIEVAHTKPAEDFIAARKAPTDPLTLQTPVPEGRTADSGALGDLGRALVHLTFDDVLTAESEQIQGLAFPTTFTATTTDGVRYAIHLAEKEGSHYARVEASAQPAQAPTEGGAAANEEKDGTATEGAQESSQKPGPAAVAETFNSRHGGWTYRMPEYTYRRLAKGLGELLAEKK